MGGVEGEKGEGVMLRVRLSRKPDGWLQDRLVHEETICPGCEETIRVGETAQVFRSLGWARQIVAVWHHDCWRAVFRD